MLPLSAGAFDLTNELELEGRFFLHNPRYEDQLKDDYSFALKSEFYFDEISPLTFTLTPYFRYDRYDKERSHFDLREAMFLLPLDKIEIRAGVGKVFWGVTESLHLVDIINQTDFVEAFDGEDKLGQPMLNVSFLNDYGVFDLFMMPFFRERTFPGRKGRPRFPIVIDMEHPIYEHKKEDRHIDFAARLSETIGNLDVAVSVFDGTTREPDFVPIVNVKGELTLKPYYFLMTQIGAELQYVFPDTLLKMEYVVRHGDDFTDYYAYVTGFEYTLPLYLEGKTLSIVSEYMYDSRDRNKEGIFQNDIMLGLRYSLNDIHGSELFTGAVIDLDYDTQNYFLEFSRRIFEVFKVEVTANIIESNDQDDFYYFLRDDDSITVKLFYYF